MSDNIRNEGPYRKTISKRVFVVGCPRSGTTLLQSMLMSHPRIHSFPETHYFARSFGAGRSRLLSSTLRGFYMWYLLVKWQLIQKGAKLGNIFSTNISCSTTQMIRNFQAVLDRQTYQNGCDIWIEKTPGHLRHINKIADNVPNAAFIHVVRDGRAVLASLYRLSISNPKIWGKYRNIEVAISRWNQSIQATLQHVMNDAHFIVEYDQCVELPEHTLRRICTFLNIDFDEAMVTKYYKSAALVIKEHESWKSSNTQTALQANGLTTFYSLFSPEKQRYIDRSLDWLGYTKLGFSKKSLTISNDPT